MYKYIDTITNGSGTALSGITVTVSLFPSGAAIIYSDDGVTVIASSIVTTDNSGTFQFYAPPDRYTFTVKQGATTLKTITDIPIPDDAEESVTSVANLRLITGSYTNQTIEALGYYASGDSGGGKFYWDAASSATDNAGTVIKPTAVSGAGRWLALDTAVLNVQRFGGASVSARIDAAITALGAGPGVVLIPRTLGAGEPTVAISNNITVIDERGSLATLSGRKTIINGADANGQIRFLVIDDQTSPTLSNAAALFLSRATGTLPDSKNFEAVQISGAVNGALSNSPTNFILSGLESTVNIYSTGQTIPFAWGLHATSATETGSTTNVTELASIYAVAPTKAGTGVITGAFSLIAGDPGSAGSSENYAIWSKGSMKVGGDIVLNRGGTAGNSTFLSGAAAQYYFVDLGTSGVKLRAAVAGATNDFISGTVQGDAIVYTPGANDLWLGANGAMVLRLKSSGDVQWGPALVALGGGAAPTLGTIGGSGPATAAQNTWMRVLDSTGAAFWVPAWK